MGFGRKKAKHPRRKRIGGEARRALIVKAAAQLFAERGFSGSTREIAARLGVTQALLYRYFSSKDKLVAAVFESFRDRWDADRAAVLTARTRPLTDRLCEFYFAYVSRNADFSGGRLLMRAALDGIDLPLRYRPDLDARVLMPVVNALRAEAGLPAVKLPLRRTERELAMGLHGAIIFIGIRRHIYRVTMSDAQQRALIRGIIRAYLPGALDRFKLSCDN